jgi:4-amino-4-deoxy-L-arabinose transferase-like glycosyltransferase
MHHLKPAGRGAIRRPAAVPPLVATMAPFVASLAPLVAILALAGALRFAYLGDAQLFRDEATSWYLASQSPGELFRLSSHETFPPLYVLLLKVWMALFGDSETALRSLSAVTGLATVVVAWRWARDAAGSMGGIVAGLLVALSPGLVINSRDARMYSLETLFATTAWWLLWRLVSDPDGPSRRRVAMAAALVGAVAGELWTLSLGIPMACLQLVFALLAWAWLRNRRSIAAAGCIALGSVSLLPWLPNLLGVALNGQPFWTGRPDLAAAALTLQVWLSGELGTLVLPVVGLAVALALIGLAGAFLDRLPTTTGSGPSSMVGERRLPRARLLALAMVLEFALMPALWVYSQVHSIYDPRYLGPAFPALAVSIAAAVGVVGSWLRTRGRFSPRLPSSVVAAALVIPLVGAMALGATRAADGSRLDANVEAGRQAERQLAVLVHPGDVVIALNAQTFFPLRYYFDQTGDAARLHIGLFDWHRSTAAFYTGWEDIDSSAVVDPASIARVGWREAVGLGQGGELWIVTIVNARPEFKAFDQLEPTGLRIVETRQVSGGAVPAVIREVVATG